MQPATVLIVEDERLIAESICYSLQQEGFRVLNAFDGAAGLALAQEERPDLILLDILLPGMNGLDLCRELRRTSDVPIIMLTARGEEMDRVNGLEAGVDDYIVKPFSSRELVARIRAVLRRSPGGDGEGIVELGKLRIDEPAHRVFADGSAVPIGPTEYRLLHFFMTHADRVYSRTQLLDHVWGSSVYVEERTVDVHIRRLRKTLEPFGLDGMVQTVRSAGYRFSAES